jgi:hypothetical protein
LFLVSAVLASVASSLALPLLPTVAHAADDCLSSPTRATGGHWRYHLERSTGRKCWYLAGATSKDDAANADAARADPATADADGRNLDTTASVPPRPVAKIAPTLERAAASPPERPRAAKPTPTPSSPATLGPANNAHAEFIDTPNDAQPSSSMAAKSGAPPAAATDANAQQGSPATRWPDPGSAPAADSSATAANSAPISSAQSPAAETQPAADQPAQTAPADQAAPSSQSADPADGPDYLLYALIIFTTAFAAVAAFAGLRFLMEWWRDWREETRWRQSEQTYAGYRERSMTAMDDVPMALVPADDASIPQASAERLDQPEPPPRIEDEIDRIERLLAMTRHSAPETELSTWDTHAPRDAAE